MGGGQVPKSEFGCVGKKNNLLFFTMSPTPRLTRLVTRDSLSSQSEINFLGCSTFVALGSPFNSHFQYIHFVYILLEKQLFNFMFGHDIYILCYRQFSILSY